MMRSEPRGRGHAPPTLSRGQLLALVTLFILTSLAFLVLDRDRLLDPFKAFLERPVRALSARFASGGERISRWGDRFGDARALRAEVERLAAENARLRYLETRVGELERDNQQLTEMAHVAQKYPQYKLQPARVIGRDPKSREKFLTIDQGSEDGLQYGMPVVSPNFLVGIVTEVYPHRARVTLIIDEDSHIGVQMEDEPRAPGILDGNWQKGGYLVMRFVDRTVTVPEKAKIITSATTERVPPGLLVGIAGKSKKSEQNDSQQVEVFPLAQFDGLESVTVILTTER